jgi:uncharacterized protein YoxC
MLEEEALIHGQILLVVVVKILHLIIFLERVLSCMEQEVEEVEKVLEEMVLTELLC